MSSKRSIRESRPAVVVLAGPNGAGKSTAGPALIRETFGITEFVNADTIAQGLSAFDPGRSAVAAGRVMLSRLRELARRRESFAFETTLASRSFAPWIKGLKRDGYVFGLLFLWLSSPELALARVRDRVLLGGHDVPENVIRRRYTTGLRNLFALYRPLATVWRVYDNTETAGPRPIAVGQESAVLQVADPVVWRKIQENIGYEE